MAKIMINSEDQDFLDLFLPFTAADGHSVSIVPGKDAVMDKITEVRPDLFLLDVMSPKDKAAIFGLLKEIQQCALPRRLPVIVLTGINDEYPFNFKPQDLDSEWFPVSGLVEKPVDLPLLRRKIAELLEKYSNLPRFPGEFHAHLPA